jgi:primosomal protein N'
MDKLLCPNCESDQVTLAHIQTFMANTGEHYCHSVKTQDSDSPAHCLECEWTGEHKDLVEMKGGA